MNTIAQKITYLNETKQLLKQSLNDLGAKITDEDTFRSYAQKINDIYENWPKVSEKNTNFTLNSTKEGKMKIELKGNTSQESTTGKNLLPNNATTQTVRGITFTINEDKSITLNGANDNTGSSTLFLITEADNFSLNAGTYNSIATGASDVNIGAYDGTNYYTFAGSSGNSITLQNNTSFTSVYLQVSKGNSTTFNNKKIYPILSLTPVSESDYEPYTGGNPAPNPDYPQDIHTVSGDNIIKVEGKNLFDKTKLTNGKYINSNGTETSYYAYSLTDYMTIQPNTTYSYQGISNYSEYGAYYNSNKELISTFVENVLAESQHIITPNNAQYVRFTIINTNQDINNFQLEKGTTATPYEAYKGASYPISLGDIELCKIGDYQDVIKRSSGKNLIDIKGIVKGRIDNENIGYESDVTDLILNNDSISFTTDANYRGVATSLIPVEPNTDYYYNERTRSTIGHYVDFYDKNGTWLSRSSTIAGTSSSNFQIPTLSTSYYIRISYQLTNSGSATIQNIMLNKGSTALPYEPYRKVWYKYGAIGKVVLDGSENWIYDTSGGFNRFSTLLQDSFVGTGRQICLSNYFTNNLTTNADGICFIVNQNVYLYKNDTTTVNDFKTWLSTHNTIVYYVLATPTYTEITDTTLIEQLDNLEKAYSYDTQTNISQENNDKPFILDVTALKKNSSN